MITDNQRLAMDYRDSELWKDDFPTSYGNMDSNRCSKCGKAFDKEMRISVNISNAHGIEHYDYHKSCVTNALINASTKQKSTFNA